MLTIFRNDGYLLPRVWGFSDRFHSFAGLAIFVCVSHSQDHSHPRLMSLKDICTYANATSAF